MYMSEISNWHLGIIVYSRVYTPVEEWFSYFLLVELFI